MVARRPIRAAVAQMGPVAFDMTATLTRIDEMAAEAHRAGASLVVFPEAVLPCYPKGLNFGARVGMRSAEGRAAFRRYFEHAVAIPGPVVTALGATAKRYGLHLVIGVVERDGGTLYCTVLFLGPDGRPLGVHRKVMPTAMERLIWGFGDGSTLTVLDTSIGKMGAVICWENYMPLLRTAMYAQGVELYCAPTVDDRDSWIPTMRHIGFEGRCFVLSACQYATRADFPADYNPIQGDEPRTVLIRGGSCIVSPMGALVAGPVYDQACVLVADIDLGEIAEGKYDFDVVGHYARPDIFQLLVNRDARMPVADAQGPLGSDTERPDAMRDRA